MFIYVTCAILILSTCLKCITPHIKNILRNIFRGPRGHQGISGQGLTGKIGPRGETGEQGRPGYAGPPGQMGPVGCTGRNGQDGKDLIVLHPDFLFMYHHFFTSLYPPCLNGYNGILSIIEGYHGKIIPAEYQREELEPPRNSWRRPQFSERF